jgi:hypothetical protein
VGGPAELPPVATNASANSTRTAVEWMLGDAPAAGPGWSPGGEYGLLDWDYVQTMLDRWCMLIGDAFTGDACT